MLGDKLKLWNLEVLGKIEQGGEKKDETLEAIQTWGRKKVSLRKGS